MSVNQKLEKYRKANEEFYNSLYSGKAKQVVKASEECSRVLSSLFNGELTAAELKAINQIVED